MKIGIVPRSIAAPPASGISNLSFLCKSMPNIPCFLLNLPTMGVKIIVVISDIIGRKMTFMK